MLLLSNDIFHKMKRTCLICSKLLSIVCILIKRISKELTSQRSSPSYSPQQKLRFRGNNLNSSFEYLFLQQLEKKLEGMSIVTRFQNWMVNRFRGGGRGATLRNVYHKGILSNPIWANSSITLPCTLARSARDYDRSICKLMCFASIVCHSLGTN